jgi:hypothetical protein
MDRFHETMKPLFVDGDDTLTETRQRRKPSETICPATVATRDALWPAHRSPKAKMKAAPAQRLSDCRSCNNRTAAHPDRRGPEEEHGHRRYRQSRFQHLAGERPHSKASIFYEVHPHERPLKATRYDGTYSEFMMTARPRRLRTISTTE